MNPAPTPQDDGPNPEMVIADQRFQIGFLERELTSAQAALAAKDAEIELLRRDKFQLGEERRAEWTRAEKAEASLATSVAFVARLQERQRELMKEADDLWHERDQLRAEVERLTATNNELSRANDRTLGEMKQLLSAAAQDINTLRAEIERLKVAQRERTQWKCACGGTDCDGQKENKLLRTEVERLKDFELNYETLTRLLHNRFKMKDGIMPDYKVEDVLVENIQLRAEIVEQANGYAATIADLNEQLAAAKADTERLDWLETQDCWIGVFGEYDIDANIKAGGGYTQGVRAAIDSARKAQP